MLTHVLPYSIGHAHPRFCEWACGEGTLAGLLADMIMSTMNTTSGGGTQSAILIERTVIRWMRELFAFPPSSMGGLVVSGSSMATVISMAAARHQTFSTVREDGLFRQTQLVVYGSTETHICIVRALELLGLGSKAMRWIPVDDDYCIQTDALKEAIREDRQKSLIPFCIIGNAGTVNTGAFDDLMALASIARTEHLWFHVDGAFGSLITGCPKSFATF
jgi:aromatic-L-amino-acid/L-tryptophan decarboxylase